MTSAKTASQTELKANRVPLAWRDQCSSKEKLYLPWECNHERHSYEECQYDDYMRRMKLLSKQKLAAADSSSE